MTAPAAWTLDDVARFLGTSKEQVARRMRGWIAQGFPKPLPFPKRPRRWMARAIEEWAAKQSGMAASPPAPDDDLIRARIARLKPRLAAHSSNAGE
jgi:predicted DNA-binding transcriptional regulator AlpA